MAGHVQWLEARPVRCPVASSSGSQNLLHISNAVDGPRGTGRVTELAGGQPLHDQERPCHLCILRFCEPLEDGLLCDLGHMSKPRVGETTH